MPWRRPAAAPVGPPASFATLPPTSPKKMRDHALCALHALDGLRLGLRVGLDVDDVELDAGRLRREAVGAGYG